MEVYDDFPLTTDGVPTSDDGESESDSVFRSPHAFSKSHIRRRMREEHSLVKRLAVYFEAFFSGRGELDASALSYFREGNGRVIVLVWIFSLDYCS